MSNWVDSRKEEKLMTEKRAKLDEIAKLKKEVVAINLERMGNCTHKFKNHQIAGHGKFCIYCDYETYEDD